MSGKHFLLAHPAFLGAGLSETYDVVAIPSDAGARADFLRDAAPKIEAAVAIGSLGLPADLLAAAPQLKLIACMGAGYDAFDPAELKARGVDLTNCPALNAEDVADVALGLLLSAARGIADGDRRVRAGHFRTGGRQSRRVRGRKLGIVGLGAIGKAVAARAAAFGMEIAWTGPRPKPDAAYPYFPELSALATWADILCVCTRADPGTEKMIDAATLKALGAEGILINISRGSVVDEDALIAALKAGVIAAAGLDVFQEEPTPAERWRDVPHTTLTPHFGGGTRESLQESFALVAENIRRFFAGEPLKTPVR